MNTMIIPSTYYFIFNNDNNLFGRTGYGIDQYSRMEYVDSGVPASLSHHGRLAAEGDGFGFDLHAYYMRGWKEFL